MSSGSKPPVTDIWGEAATSSPDMVLPVYITTGFPAPGGVPVRPPRAYFNWLFNQAMNAVRYFSRVGIVEWDATEDTYVPGAVVRDTTDGFVYELIPGATATTGTAPHLDLPNWAPRPSFVRAIASAWAMPIQVYQNARRQRVSGVDHMGFPGGRILQIEEDWASAPTTGHSTPGSGFWFGRWRYGLIGASGAFSQVEVGNGAQTPAGLNAQVSTNSVFAAAAVLEGLQPWYQLAEAASFSFDVSVTGSSNPDSSSSFAVGLGDYTVISGANDNAFNTGSGTTPSGVAIYVNGTAGAIWHGYANPPGGGPHAATLSIALARNAVYRFRIDIYGPGSSDDGTPQVHFLVNGVDIATLAYDFTDAALTPFIRMTSNGVDPCTLNVGPLRFTARLASGDVFM